MENTRPTFKQCTNSSWVKYLQYDEQQRVLMVCAKNGQIIRYENFTDEMWDECLAAESIGKHIHHVIAPLYNKESDDDGC